MKIKTFLSILGFSMCMALQAQTPAPTAPAAATPAAPAPAPANPVPFADPSSTTFPHDAKTPPPGDDNSGEEPPTSWHGYETHFAVEFGGGTFQGRATPMFMRPSSICSRASV